MTDLVSQLVGALQSFVDDIVPNNPNDPLWEQARAALTAAKAGGWVAVPVEPTEEMLDAAFAYETQAGGIQGGDVVDAYKAMLAARPLPNPPKEQA